MVSVVLLGAGASFGSRDATPKTPPLGNALFAELEQLGGVAAQLEDDLKAQFKENFEIGMAAYASKPNEIAPLHCELASYLAQFLPGPNNTYRRLVRELGISRVIYCSLNYDLLFEEAAAGLGFNVIYDDHRPTPHSVRLIKPHGSCNVWPDFGSLRIGKLTSIGSVVDVDAPVRILSRDQILEWCRSGRGFSPAISMYAEGKQVKVCPEWVAQQQNLWSAAIARATNVFIVGVKVHQADLHIWDAIGRCTARVVYYGYSDQDRAEFADWKNFYSRKSAFFVQADFENSVTDMRLRLKGQ